jgi:hypothetical protein
MVFSYLAESMTENEYPKFENIGSTKIRSSLGRARELQSFNTLMHHLFSANRA